MDSINNPFGHKVKFEQVTDNKAVKDLMMAKARSAAGDGGEVSEEVKKLRMEKEREIQTYEDQLMEMKNNMEEMKVEMDQFEVKREEISEKEKLVDEEIETKHKIFKKQKELLTEISKLESQDINALETEVGNFQN